MTELLAHTDGLLLTNLTTVFAPELSPLDEEEREELLTSLDAASSWECWERLRRRKSLTIGTSRRIMMRTLQALLADVEL